MKIRTLNARISSAVVVASICACTIAPYDPPSMPFTVTTSSGIVHAETAEDASRIALLLEHYGPRVRTILDAESAVVPEITAMATDLPDGASQGGVCIKPSFERGFILIRSMQHPVQDFALVHELVHFYVHGYWQLLSTAMQEGIANEIARSLVPPESTRPMSFIYMSALFSYPDVDPVHELDQSPGEYYSHDDSAARGISYFVARKLGVDGLREVCREAERAEEPRVSARALLERAGLSLTDTTSWYRTSDHEKAK
jgi:hypothetical protein